MWTKLIAAAALAAMFGFAPVAAQEAPDEPVLPSATDADSSLPSANDTEAALSSEMLELTGWPVYGSAGEEIGEVKRVKRAAGGEPEAIHVDMGGFLGIGETTREIPADKFVVGDERIDLTMTADEASKLPEVEQQ